MIWFLAILGIGCILGILGFVFKWGGEREWRMIYFETTVVDEDEERNHD